MSERSPGPPFDCPICGEDGLLTATDDGELVNFLCHTCGTCWHPELGWLRQVDPYHCQGCEFSGVCRLAVTPQPEAEVPPGPRIGDI